MTALALLQQLPAFGVVLTPSPDGTLRYKAPKGVLTPALLDAMRQHKQELHGLVEDWSERAAIAEYCGGLPRVEAQALAGHVYSMSGDMWAVPRVGYRMPPEPFHDT
jgi:hypothetical protein